MGSPRVFAGFCARFLLTEAIVGDGVAQGAGMILCKIFVKFLPENCPAKKVQKTSKDSSKIDPGGLQNGFEKRI